MSAQGLDRRAPATHLLDVQHLGTAGIERLLRLAQTFEEVSGRSIPKVPALRGRTVATAFFEPSTRTRLSFEAAARRLSADVMTFSATGSSLGKGESLRDTAETLESLGADLLVVRHRSPGVPAQIASWLSASVVNAGDGAHAHPTQALLDCYTLRSALGDDLAGAKICIVGDVAHSRVARSLVEALVLLGAEASVVGPPTLVPASAGEWGARVSFELDPLLAEVDALYLLRLQSERMGQHLLPSLEDYARGYRLDAARERRLRHGVPILHPGPVNRGVELTQEVADGPRSLVRQQVRNGVPVRMAVLFELLGEGRLEESLDG